MLGYKAYHMFEVIWGGPLQMALFEEALRCKYLDGGKPYGKAEFDKWLAEYDGTYRARNNALWAAGSSCNSAGGRLLLICLQ